MEIIGIERRLSTPYHAQSNGMVERFNGTLKNMLHKLTADKPHTQDELIPAVLFTFIFPFVHLRSVRAWLLAEKTRARSCLKIVSVASTASCLNNLEQTGLCLLWGHNREINQIYPAIPVTLSLIKAIGAQITQVYQSHRVSLSLSFFNPLLLTLSVSLSLSLSLSLSPPPFISLPPFL